eukprot:7057278-Lingulodinium_polyedra.AAC.1
MTCCGWPTFRGALTASYFAEIDPGFADPVARRWGEHAALGQAVPHIKLAGDVWEFLRGGAR